MASELSYKQSKSVTFLLLATCCIGCMAATTTKDLEPFDSISICAPLNVLVVPSTNGASQIRIEADMASSLSATVSGSRLSIETTGSMQANNDIKVTVSLPATALRALEVRSSLNVYLAPGFVSKALQLTTGQLGGTIAASQLSAEQLSIFAAGLAKVTVEGRFGDVSVDAEGASSVLIAGLEKKATLTLSGLPTVAITANNGAATIVGTSQGSQVVYNQGRCSVKGLVPGVALCMKDAGLKISAFPLRWTCKATITGASTCHTSGSSASTFISTGSDCSIMSWETPKTASNEKPTFNRRLRQTTISSATSSSKVTSSSGSRPASYTYSTTSSGASGQQSVTSCSFVNGIGGCQVDGTPVPVQQLDVDFPPTPSPGPLGGPLAAEPITPVTRAANAATTISTATATGTGGTSCVFVNGIGGCQSGG